MFYVFINVYITLAAVRPDGRRRVGQGSDASRISIATIASYCDYCVLLRLATIASYCDYCILWRPLRPTGAAASAKGDPGDGPANTSMSTGKYTVDIYNCIIYIYIY